MFRIYRITVGLLFYCSLPISLLFVWITGKHREGLLQRFGLYPQNVDKGKKKRNIWLHAASVGEVQAARAIIAEIRKQLGESNIFLTTMTLAGRKVAESQIEPKVSCYLAPLDIPGIVELAIKRIKPDVYICIETELWPVLLDALSQRQVYVGMANGRISSRSFEKYKKLGGFIAYVLGRFDRMAVISEKDRAKYLSLGASPYSLIVEGNVKYDIKNKENTAEIVRHYKELLQITTEEVFIAGSTHNDEEHRLLEMLINQTTPPKLLFLFAPRHIERIASLEKFLQSQKYDYHLLSQLKTSIQQRKHSLILVDTMGDLAELYGVSDYIFCGGSLVPKGGHNLMEAAIWGRAVFYGPFIDDFHDAADLLESEQCGFKIADVADLEKRLHYYRVHSQEYFAACHRAGKVAKSQQGSSSRQVSHIFGGFLDNRE